MLHAKDILNVRSIAIPAISAGVFRVPIHIVALAIGNATRTFDRYLTTLPPDRKHIAHIKIVNTDDKIVEMLATEIGRELACMDPQHAQADGNGFLQSDRLGHSHAPAADASDGAAGTTHAERSAD